MVRGLAWPTPAVAETLVCETSRAKLNRGWAVPVRSPSTCSGPLSGWHRDLAFMGNEAWLLLPVALARIYLAAVLAAVDGTIRAFHDRFLPPWVVGLVVVVLLVLLDQH